MGISETYDIQRIIRDIEVALQIDGGDYGEKDVDTILSNIYMRIIRQYQLDLRGKSIYDESFYLGKSKDYAVLFVDNISALHSRLCGYLQIVRYTKYVTIKPANINWMGFRDKSLLSFFISAMDKNTIEDIHTAVQAIKGKFRSINMCTEKRLILILIVAYELGFNELVAAISEILYLGGKI